MKMKKKIWHGLFVLLCLFILMLPAIASSIPAERQKPLLVDDAGLLTTEESTALLEKLEEISQRQQNEVAIVTVNSLDGKTAQAYADDYYDYNRYGYGENDDGIVLVIVWEKENGRFQPMAIAILQLLQMPVFLISVMNFKGNSAVENMHRLLTASPICAISS